MTLFKLDNKILNLFKIGSIEFQIYKLTYKIKYLQIHLKKNIHDFNSYKEMIKIICKRRKLLKYLKNKNYISYNDIKNQLKN